MTRQVAFSWEPRDAAHEYGTSVDDFKSGQRVELSPACDRWMQGARFGNVQRTNRAGQVFVRLDLTGKVESFAPEYLRHVRC